jgi:hypothetical protein
MAWQGNGMGAAWTRHVMCESALMVTTFRGVGEERVAKIVKNCEEEETQKPL